MISSFLSLRLLLCFICSFVFVSLYFSCFFVFSSLIPLFLSFSSAVTVFFAQHFVVVFIFPVFIAFSIFLLSIYKFHVPVLICVLSRVFVFFFLSFFVSLLFIRAFFVTYSYRSRFYTWWPVLQSKEASFTVPLLPVSDHSVLEILFKNNNFIEIRSALKCADGHEQHKRFFCNSVIFCTS